MKQKVGSASLNIILIVCSVLTILPFLWMLCSSFKTNAEINALAQTFLPQNFTAQNYADVLQKFDFLRYFLNSLFYALVITVVTVYTSALAGFVLCKYRFKGRQMLFTLILMTMMVPGVVTIIPRYSMMQFFGWLDTYRALIIPSVFTPFGIFMMRQACTSIPNEILEAARIDGANEFYTFHRIVLPQLRNSIVSISIFQFLWAWDDYLWPYLIIRSGDKQLLSVALNLFSGRYSTDYAGLFAATAIAIIPVVIFYIIFQKRFVEGVSASAVKG
ncbi:MULTISPECIES: carbohydrate ABC transporter permease [Oscillospiraceae]|jgi:sugar ABC transporter, permease protein|uniref:Carbohydrate ABC transporter permease n=1 Tax=Lawsonibacter faecis TaxID=2763052 RepID=A0A8J6JD44_9FIRM|nr:MULTISPECIES: carbohydrate ABC transporter permease [Oscillospiraceae]MTQ95410.1 ABC transporter permease subunit [Pseudoflavonifractor sp. BIOML-A16]MTR07282.1 ABC transporter permease subunit [Pseudoflavonifractor sp. BIOML-A15]MTR32422.1 ABC transporter permease subunit [Pseudoflavonifractor sp. BIOML-A14]MTR72774.1 ABC transporter permease subunit [Pseudoflavonifractor sp. BIOML-A18]MTS64328.1 ABC transporter permease subunit [Pseudoflavonifractor sp. BIOML-A5]MTS70168.1 ABC transporte